MSLLGLTGCNGPEYPDVTQPGTTTTTASTSTTGDGGTAGTSTATATGATSSNTNTSTYATGGSTTTTSTDPNLIPASSSLYKIYNSNNLSKLSGGSATGNSDADQFINEVSRYLTAVNSAIYDKITVASDTSTYDFGDGYESKVGFVVVSASPLSSAPDAIKLIDNMYDISPELLLDLGAEVMAVAVNNLYYNGELVTAASTLTYYGTDADANNLHTLEYVGDGQVQSVTVNYDQTNVNFTDSTELAGAEAGAEQMFSFIEDLLSNGEYTTDGF